MKNPRIVCYGELLWDIFPEGPRLGGAAANLAFHAAQLGAEALLVSRVGDDELGARARRLLGRAGVDVRFVGVDRTRPTGSVRVEIVDGEPRYTIAEQAAWDAITIEAELLPMLGAADVFCYGTLAQRTPLGGASLERAFDDLSERCITICDLNIRPPHVTSAIIDRAIARARVIKLNESEAAALERAFELENAIDWLIETRRIELVALTRGARGALLATAARRVEAAAVPAGPGGDAVGAGDAFTAVLACELARETPIDELLARANRYASRVASAPGGMPDVYAE